MMFAEDEDGSLLPVTRDNLRRVWVWQQGRLHSQLVMRNVVGEVIEAKRRDGWHAWETDPLMLRLD
jgi:hypothetical protein